MIFSENRFPLFRIMFRHHLLVVIVLAYNFATESAYGGGCPGEIPP